jgi:hypothetical protein
MIQIFKDTQHTRKAQHRVRIKDLRGEMRLIGYYDTESEADIVIKALGKADNFLFFERLTNT